MSAVQPVNYIIYMPTCLYVPCHAFHGDDGKYSYESKSRLLTVEAIQCSHL